MVDLKLKLEHLLVLNHSRQIGYQGLDYGLCVAFTAAELFKGWPLAINEHTFDDLQAFCRMFMC